MFCIPLQGYLCATIVTNSTNARKTVVMEIATSSQQEIATYRKVLPELEARGFDFSQDWICEFVKSRARELGGTHWEGVASFFIELCQLDDPEPLFRVLMSSCSYGEGFRTLSPFLECDVLIDAYDAALVRS